MSSLLMPALAQQLLEVGLADDVAADLVLELAGPVEADRAGDVPFVVGVGVDVDLDELDAGVACRGRRPTGWRRVRLRLP